MTTVAVLVISARFQEYWLPEGAKYLIGDWQILVRKAMPRQGVTSSKPSSSKASFSREVYFYDHLVVELEYFTNVSFLLKALQVALSTAIVS